MLRDKRGSGVTERPGSADVAADTSGAVLMADDVGNIIWPIAPTR
jgi:hypothetical protein